MPAISAIATVFVTGSPSSVTSNPAGTVSSVRRAVSGKTPVETAAEFPLVSVTTRLTEYHELVPAMRFVGISQLPFVTPEIGPKAGRAIPLLNNVPDQVNAAADNGLPA